MSGFAVSATQLACAWATYAIPRLLTLLKVVVSILPASYESFSVCRCRTRASSRPQLAATMFVLLSWPQICADSPRLSAEQTNGLWQFPQQEDPSLTRKSRVSTTLNEGAPDCKKATTRAAQIRMLASFPTPSRLGVFQALGLGVRGPGVCNFSSTSRFSKTFCVCVCVSIY